MSADNQYTADIWYWKSYRTDHAGYADDKMHIYSALDSPNAKKRLSDAGRRFYLSRPGDRGEAAYEARIYPSYVDDEVEKYTQRTPQGSRADIRAKGSWRDGVWTVEFRRKLDTGHGDDVQFQVGGRYLFGVSRYEIAGRKPDPNLEEPYFGSGEIGDPITLAFQ